VDWASDGGRQSSCQHRSEKIKRTWAHASLSIKCDRPVSPGPPQFRRSHTPTLGKQDRRSDWLPYGNTTLFESFGRTRPGDLKLSFPEQLIKVSLSPQRWESVIDSFNQRGPGPAAGERPKNQCEPEVNDFSRRQISLIHRHFAVRPHFRSFETETTPLVPVNRAVPRGGDIVAEIEVARFEHM